MQKLSSSQLEAFSAVAKAGSFSRAAESLHITQSALSQRIMNLEAELATGLIIRDPSGLRLTAIGETLLRYCSVKDSLEEEFLAKISSTKSELGGVIRIAGFSSALRSVVMPALAEFIANHSRISIEFYCRELADLPHLLTSGEADIIVTSQPSSRQEITTHDLGFEEYHLVESANIKTRKEIYLDHDVHDKTTYDFLKLNSVSTESIHRNYLDEVYALMDGVKLGWGRAVLPKHLLRSTNDLKIVKGYKPLKMPVQVQYFRQPYYSKLHTSVVDLICKKSPALLGK